jgi:ferredoxin--NADP+ reductase
MIESGREGWMAERNWRVAVVGAGPAGLYGAEALARRGAAVDVFESQFAPFGLVRYGVAPDHQKIKRTQVVFERILARPEVRLFANVRVGTDLKVSELLQQYDQVLVTTGSSGARELGVPGSDLPGNVSATAFVNWYNGHPDYVEAAPSLHSERAVIVGMGNVAIDVARILVRDPAELASTDISARALSVLGKSAVREVILLSRRGPNQAAFDEKEVRELAALPGVQVVTDGYVSKRTTKMSEFLSTFPRATEARSGRRVVLHFCASPVEISGKERVERIKVERNTLVESAARMRAVGTGDYWSVDAGLVVEAIGYHGKALAGVPFHELTGTIPNEEGRVLTEPDGERVPGLYVAGWIKRGPTGLIGTNKGCATDTVALMEADLDQMGPERDPNAIIDLLKSRRVRFLSTADWQRLDAYELEAGARLGKVRDKLLSLEQALRVLGDTPAGEEDSTSSRSEVRATSSPGSEQTKVGGS